MIEYTSMVSYSPLHPTKERILKRFQHLISRHASSILLVGGIIFTLLFVTLIASADCATGDTCQYVNDALANAVLGWK